MNKEIKRVSVPSEIINEAQRLDYEFQGLDNLLRSILKEQPIEIKYNKEMLEHFTKLQKEAFAKRKIYMDSLVFEYGSEYNNRSDILVNLDYINSDIVYTEIEKCSCNIKSKEGQSQCKK